VQQKKNQLVGARVLEQKRSCGYGEGKQFEMKDFQKRQIIKGKST
jgi:hypothetical protein